MPDKYNGDIDPQIASLIGLTSDSTVPNDFVSLIDDDITTAEVGIIRFKPCIDLQGPPHPAFADKNYYKKVLSQTGDIAQKLHLNLTNFLNASDPADKSVYRGRMITAYWELCTNVASRITFNLPAAQLMLLRYGLISPSFLSPAQLDMICRLKLKNDTGEPIYYQDEWLMRISRGLENSSATDELKRTKKDTGQKVLEKLEKNRGQKESEQIFLHTKLDQRSALESRLKDCLRLICDHSLAPRLEGMEGPYSDSQKKLIAQAGDTLRQLLAIDKEVTKSFITLHEISQSLSVMEKSAGDIAPTMVDSATVVAEFNTIRQMIKLCVGRKGNHFPFLMKNYFRPNLRDIGIRENVINELAYIESIDTELFYRTFKNQTSRIVPHIILLPNYGEYGICWEPFERLNRATSRGRVAIPMYPKNLRVAVLAACADLRWQVAKEKAQHYWMEEGITGKYYMWFQEKKFRGDVRAAFINDYIFWITKEYDGVQKLDREVRGIFWRLIPFPQDVKEKLRNRGFVYNELFKKDINISRSDGY